MLSKEKIHSNMQDTSAILRNTETVYILFREQISCAYLFGSNHFSILLSIEIILLRNCIEIILLCDCIEIILLVTV